jgi:hypothetical protein
MNNNSSIIDSYDIQVANNPAMTGATTYPVVTTSTTAVSRSVTDLTSGVYYYRVRAHNASGYSTYSAAVAVSTTPVATAPSPITITINSFIANWQAVAGASNYQLDVSADSNFGTLLANYTNVSVNGISQNVSGLIRGTTYYYRVRAVYTSGISLNSNPISQITLPDAPQNFSTSENQASNIKVSWSPVVSATQYELQVSQSDTFNPLLMGYDPKIIPSNINLTETVVTPLTPVTIYYFRILARNMAGVSVFSATKLSSTTQSSGGSQVSIQYTTTQATDVHLPNQVNALTINATGGIGTITASLYHKKISETNFTADQMNAMPSNNYQVILKDEWFDKLGMEYYFVAQDLANQKGEKKDQSGKPFIFLAGVSNVVVPITHFGSQVKDYQIISFPYKLTEFPRISDALEHAMGSYDKKKWRLFHYQDGKNVEYSEGVSVDNIKQGNAYWFISKNQVDLSFGKGTTLGNSISSPFKISLAKGWNQIGNPFPYDLSWADVQAVNPPIGKLNVFDKATVAFAESDALKVFSGGFVFADNAMDLTFPVTLPNKGGRKATNPTDDHIDNDGWMLPIQLSQGEVINTLSGIGMRLGAVEGKDKFDKVTPPRFFRYLELNSKKNNYEFNLSTDVINQVENHRWDFQIESNSGEAVELKWSKQIATDLLAKLILYDHTKQVVIDMSRLDSYTTISNATISIHYGKSTQMEAAQIELGKAYPNPFHTEITIPYAYTMDEPSQAEFIIYDLTGRILVQRTITGSQPGIQMIQWNGTTNQGSEMEPGMYVYKMRATQGKEIMGFNGKIVKQ